MKEKWPEYAVVMIWIRLGRKDIIGWSSEERRHESVSSPENWDTQKFTFDPISEGK